VCIAAGESPVGHCCPKVCPLATQPDHTYSCDPNATLRCPTDTHFCHRLSDGGFSQSLCCRRPCNAMAPSALYVNVTHPLRNPSQTCTRDCESETLSRDTTCMKPVPLEAHCFIQRQCPVNSGCYRGRCQCKCGFKQDRQRCVALPPPPTTTRQPAVIVPGIGVAQGGDFLRLIGNFFSGTNTMGGTGR
ncbi:unnamed protein product, partial [Gongylonema pulchrum]|uniref:EB domain-containing protein n=1 Tax=Gongylonema pulchrum TaxID=637853 RepID=A0A183CYT0_9BILA